MINYDFEDPFKCDIFHVHTFRCEHSDIKEEEMIEKAIEIGARRISFSDHCPFPGNPFRNRMKYENIDEYIESINNLKKKYEGKIEISCGLETEYLPSYKSFYEELKQNEKIDFLILGQHLWEVKKGLYSFQYKFSPEEYYQFITETTVDGINTGYFDAVAHPDRMFKRMKAFDGDMARCSHKVILAAINMEIPLEKNYSSMGKENYYWDDFWVRASKAKIIYGYDIHWIKDIERLWRRAHPAINMDEIIKLLNG